MSDFKIGFCSIALRDLPFEEAILQIADAGFHHIEVWHRHVIQIADADLEGIAELAREKGIRFTVLSPYFSFTRGTEAWNESLRTGEKVTATARVLGIRKIRTFVDVGHDGLPSCRADESHWKQAKEGLRALCAIDPSMDFVVETHPNTLADTLPTVKRLLAEVDQPNFKLNFQANPDFLERGLFDCLLDVWPHVGHMHLQQFLAAGGEGYIEEDGVIDFVKLTDFLKTHHYTGTASVEYCWKNADPARIPTAHRFLKGLGVV